MTFLPDLRLEIAFDSGVRTPIASRTWTDVSEYVELEQGITITGGRADERSVTEANRLELTLDNTDGRFTPERASSPYYPDVKIGRPIRLRADLDDDGTFETDLFLGFVEEWPLEWLEGVDTSAAAQLVATGRLAWLGEGEELRSIIEAEWGVDSPVAHYTLGEAEGATTAADSSESSAPLLRQTQDRSPASSGSGAVTFGTATGPGTDGLTAATFIEADGKWLQAQLDPPPGDWTAECFFIGPQSQVGVRPLGFGQVCVDVIDDTEVAIRGGIEVDSSFDVIDPLNVNDNATHHLAIRWTAATKTADLLIDGVLVASITDSTDSITHDGVLYVGNGAAGTTGTDKPTIDRTWGGSIAHAAVYHSALSDARIAEHAEAGTTGFAGELADDRLARYLTYAGLTAADLGASSGDTPLAHIDTTGKPVLEAMRIVEITDGGVLYDRRDGLLGYTDKATRYQATSSLTLDVATQELAAGARPVLDRSALVNDVTAKNLTDTLTSRVIDSASRDDYGKRALELELATDDEDLPFQTAAAHVNRYGQPRLRLPALAPVDILALDDTALRDLIVAADVGTRLTVTNQPAQAAATDADYFVEGYTDAIGLESWARSFNVSAGALYDVWLLDSATQSQLDSTTILAL